MVVKADDIQVRSGLRRSWYKEARRTMLMMQTKAPVIMTATTPIFCLRGSCSFRSIGLDKFGQYRPRYVVKSNSQWQQQGNEIGEYSQTSVGKVQNRPIDASPGRNHDIPGFCNWTAAEDVRKNSGKIVSDHEECRNPHCDLESPSREYPQVEEQNRRFGSGCSSTIHNRGKQVPLKITDKQLYIQSIKTR